MCISTPRSSLVVRFLSVFLLCCSSLYASTDQTGKQKVTVIGTDVTLETVFRQIERQTGLRFMYAVDAVDVKEKVTVMFEKVMLDNVLESLLGKKRIEWVYREGVISLRPTITKNNVILNSDTLLSRFKVSGKLSDSKGNPIPGVTVILKNSVHKGTKSDSEGRFKLEGIKMNETLVLSSIGYKTKEIVVEDQNIVLQMEEVVNKLDETIIRGYGMTTQRFNTGNLVSIKARDLANQPVSDPLLTLQGRAPGVIVTQTTGLQGAKVNIQIRGRNSINSGTQPLFIVDGVPFQPTVAAPPLGSYGALGTTISGLNFINPADIESIDILKDADATAIYGSRGANGVVIITTKKGGVGVTKVDISVNKGWQHVAKKRKLLNTKEYLKMRREAFYNDDETPTIENAPDLLEWDTSRYTDWQRELVGHAASYLDAQANIYGGESIIQYRIGGNYHKETTIFPGDFSNQRGGGHFSFTASSVNQRLKANVTGSYSISKMNYPGADFASNVDLPPNAPAPYNLNGSLNWANYTWRNPYVALVSRILDAQTTNMVHNIEVNYRLFPTVLFKFNLGYNELVNSGFMGTTIAGAEPRLLASARASATYTSSKIRSWISEPQISYNETLGNGNIDLIVGATMLGNKQDNQYVFTGGIESDELIRNPAAANSYSVRSLNSKYRYIAFFGRVGYNLEEKYLFNITYRRDGSSRFGPNKRFASFGALGVGWIFSQEKFVKNMVPFLSYGKLRASYGITGNDQIGDYQYLDQYEFQEYPYQGTKGLRVLGLFNPDFEWEKTQKAEWGIETGILKDRVIFSTSYYRNKSSNQLSGYNLPNMTGYSFVTGNLPAIIQNIGWEFLLTSQNVKREKFSWSTSFNLTVPRNKLIAYDGPNNSLKVGRALSVIDLYEFMGVNASTGIYQFANSEGKPVSISDGADNKRATVNLAPTLFGGFQNNISYGGLSIDIFFQFTKQQGKNGLFNENILPGSPRNQPKEVLERWQKVGDLTNIQRFNQNFQLFNDNAYKGVYSTAGYVDASYIRCKNIAISWQILEAWRKKLKINSGRIYILGQNLFTISRYKGWDPETQSLTVIPPLRNITVGIQVGL
ncbi:SusC/RagA family TonB-linked outer membrane protein [Chitinophaga ginsengisoli]|nr:SusC/RagA family TonB-linked outer membrane protein [Chitinophaga ginsengisoli]